MLDKIRNYWYNFWNKIVEIKQSIDSRVFSLLLLSIVLVAALTLSWFVSPPRNFPAGHVFSIEEGKTLSEIAKDLKDNRYINSETAFKFAVAGVFRSGNGAVAGDYIFEKKLSTFSLAYRIVFGKHHLDPVRVTIHEGLNKFEMAEVLARAMPSFDKERFIEIAPEGYLFPDTYFFVPNARPERVVEVMTNNFERQIEPYLEDIEGSGRTFEEVLTMASIVETEARQFETRRTISGILWKRIDENMPLQVDVTFKYVNGKVTHNLTLEDLEIDSPYNTYVYTGLPPTPIANPGLDSILATITPIDTPYYFFLADDSGETHYAATFDEHRNNKQIYLR